MAIVIRAGANAGHAHRDRLSPFRVAHQASAAHDTVSPTPRQGVAQVAHKSTHAEDILTWDNWNAGLRDSADLYEGVLAEVQSELGDPVQAEQHVTAVVAPSGAVLFRNAIHQAWLEAFPDGVENSTPASSPDAAIAVTHPADAASAAQPPVAVIEAVQARSSPDVGPRHDGAQPCTQPERKHCQAARPRAERYSTPPASSSRPRWTSASAGIRPPWHDESAPTEAAAAGAGAAQSTHKDTEAVLIRQGMSELQAERLALELHGTGSAYADAALLGAKLESLKLLLPGINVCALVMQDMDVLTVDIGRAAQRMVAMSALLGSLDLTQLITRNPVLLYGEDVEACLQRTLETFRRVLPSDYPRSVVQSVLTEAPMIMFRLEHSVEAREFSDLPSDIQRLFVIGARDGAPATSRPTWKRLVQALNKGAPE